MGATKSSSVILFPSSSGETASLLVIFVQFVHSIEELGPLRCIREDFGFDLFSWVKKKKKVLNK